MNRNQRADYVLKFNKMSVEDALKGKTTAVSSLADAEQPDIKKFSVDVASMLQSLKNWTSGSRGTTQLQRCCSNYAVVNG